MDGFSQLGIAIDPQEHWPSLKVAVPIFLDPGVLCWESDHQVALRWASPQRKLDEKINGTLGALLATLPAKQRFVLEKRFYEGWSLEQCGKSLNRTRECVRQTEAKALRKLRHPECLKVLREGLVKD